MDLSSFPSYDNDPEYDDVLLVSPLDSRLFDALDPRVIGYHKLSYDTLTCLEDVARRLHQLWATHVWRRQRIYGQDYDINNPWPCYEATYYGKNWMEVAVVGSWSLQDFRRVVRRVDMKPVEVDVCLSEEDEGGGRGSYMECFSLAEHDSYVGMATWLHKLWGSQTGNEVAPGTWISRVAESWPGYRVRMMSRDNEEIDEASVGFVECVLKLDGISIIRSEDYKSHLHSEPAPPTKPEYPMDLNFYCNFDDVLLADALDSRDGGFHKLSYDTLMSLEDVARRLHQLWANHVWRHERRYGPEYDVIKPWPCYEARFYSKDQKKVDVDCSWSLRDFRGMIHLVIMRPVKVNVRLLKEVEKGEGGGGGALDELVGQFSLADHDSYVGMATWLHRLWGRHTGNEVAPGTWISRVVDSWPGYSVQMMSRDKEEMNESMVEFTDCVLELDGILIHRRED